MSYFLNHVHIRSANPRTSAEWYEEFFDAKIPSEKDMIPGTVTVSLDVGDSTRLNISPQPDGSSSKTIHAGLNRLGLEHFGFQTDDIQSDIEKFKKSGVPIVLNITEIQGGTKLAFIEGPTRS
jgi:predicted enzyme related to lactoylglutathione lyase